MIFFCKGSSVFPVEAGIPLFFRTACLLLAGKGWGHNDWIFVKAGSANPIKMTGYMRISYSRLDLLLTKYFRPLKGVKKFQALRKIRKEIFVFLKGFQ